MVPAADVVQPAHVTSAQASADNTAADADATEASVGTVSKSSFCRARR